MNQAEVSELLLAAGTLQANLRMHDEQEQLIAVKTWWMSLDTRMTFQDGMQAVALLAADGRPIRPSSINDVFLKHLGASRPMLPFPLDKPKRVVQQIGAEHPVRPDEVPEWVEAKKKWKRAKAG